MNEIHFAEQRDQAEALLRRLPWTSPTVLWGLALGTAICLICGILLGEGNRFPFAELTWQQGLTRLIPLLLGTLGCIVVPIMVWKRFHQRKLLQEMLAGGALVRWSYSPEEWEAFRNQQREIRDGNDPRTLRCFLMAGFSGVFWGGFTILLLRGVEHPFPAPGAWGFLFGYLFAVGTDWAHWRSLIRWCRQLEQEPGEAIISPKAVFLHSRMLFWNQPGGRLMSVEFDNDNPAIRLLNFTVQVPTGHSAAAHSISIPIPHSQLNTARQLVGTLTCQVTPCDPWASQETPVVV